MAFRTFAPSPSPAHHHSQWAPSPAAAVTGTTVSTPNQSSPPPSNSKLPVDFSPPLIAMVVVVAAAFLVITYSRLISRYLIRVLRRWRRWRRRRRLRYIPSSSGDLDSPPPPFDSPDGFHVYSPYGLDESVIKTLPLFVYTTKNGFHKESSNSKDCAVCLLQFEDNDYVRTLPVCSHAFHVDCIDIWLRSHANCPLCRARIFRSDSPFTPVMASRIRPSLDDTILHSIGPESIIHTPPPSHTGNTATTTITTVTEITPCIEESSSRRNSNNFNNYSQSEDRYTGCDFLLKRSYSFGFERSLASERMLVMEPTTTSPWRYRRGSFWSKRSSPFGSLSKHRVFSFRHYKGMKSPFFRRRGGFFPLSERYPTGSGGGGSSRRSKSMASPMFQRSSVAAFSSSRLRCGDPEALLSPERYNRR
ncbi:hypothetical protein P3X46_026409 [Hevea brasiliensis]|uniref:RING-type E3 ubiquitin transferase n=1 Tax=Hevea brasiliensis TaxID=3981 RepID=A0ABQ9KXY9_HEVBR|nr:RING-H2 finger protein ATL65 [Hevea brasiliensis]KAJ9152901.1 hypothetical protein P3X46_026409 [Hevea brasiliensis]